MSRSFVLVHSPSVGPSSWHAVARLLHERGEDAVVPNLRHVTQPAGAPYWPRVASTVADAVGQLDAADPVVLVAHSSAGLFLPVVADALPLPVAGAVFVDAALPGPGSTSAVAAPELLVWLRTLVEPDGRLPRWTDWWSADDVAALVPDAVLRAGVVADQSRLPLDYYEDAVPVPPSWAGVPCAYLQFNEAYEEQADRARAAGWAVELIRGEHLHQVVDPAAVTDAIQRLSGGFVAG